MQVHDAVRTCVWVRVYQHGVDDAEPNGGCSDSKRQREHGNGGEPGILPQHVQAKAYVMQQRFEHGDAAAVAIILLGLVNAT